MSKIKEIPINIDNNGENCSASEPFALRILDASMEPEFVMDNIIIVDPSASPKTGDFVLYETSSSIIIRQIYLDEKKVLKALNSKYEDIEIKDMSCILGVITQRSGKRRKYHKRYE